MWLLERHFPWQPQPHLFANTSDCVAFVQDGSDETDECGAERKSCDPGRARALDTRHKATQCGRATRHHRIRLSSQYSRLLEDNWAPPVFITQPLISATLVRSGGVDDITGFYCTTFLLPGLEKSQNKRSGRNGTEETRTAGAAVRQTTVSTPPHRARLSFRSGGLFGVPSSRSCSTQSQRTPSVSAEPRPSQRNENRRHG